MQFGSTLRGVWWMTRAEAVRRFDRLQSAIDGMVIRMADVSNELNQVAEGLRDRLGPRLRELLERNAELEVRNAELEGEDVAESAAAANVRTEWDNIVGILEPVTEVPTPEPLPEGEGGPDSMPVQ